jgi:hypothetical protein
MDLVVNRRLWIYRIVDTVVFLDDRRVQRHRSVDFRVPDWPIFRRSESVLPSKTYVIPIGLLAKQSLVAFDVFGEAGQALPIFTSRQNHYLTSAMRELARTVESTSTDANEGVAPLGQRTRTELLTLADNFRDGIDTELTDNFFLCVLLECEVGQRRIVKYTYEETLPPSIVFNSRPSAKRKEDAPPRMSWRDHWQRTRRYVGWDPQPIELDCPSASYGPSYHIEVTPPDQLFFHVAEFQFTSRKSASETKKEESDGEARFSYASPAKVGIARAHLRLERLDKGQSVVMHAHVGMRPDGLLTGAMLVGVMASTLLVVGVLLHQAGATASGDGPAALLLVLPAVFGAVMFRPGEHRLVTRVAAGVTLVARAVVTLSLAAAGLLALHHAPDGRFVWWVVVTILALAATGLLCGIGFRSRIALQRNG